MKRRQFLAQNHQGLAEIPVLEQFQVFLLSNREEHLLLVGTVRQKDVNALEVVVVVAVAVAVAVVVMVLVLVLVVIGVVLVLLLAIVFIRILMLVGSQRRGVVCRHRQPRQQRLGPGPISMQDGAPEGGDGSALHLVAALAAQRRGRGVIAQIVEALNQDARHLLAVVAEVIRSQRVRRRRECGPVGVGWRTRAVGRRLLLLLLLLLSLLLVLLLPWLLSRARLAIGTVGVVPRP